MRIRKLEILYEDTDILVCRKPAGIATQSARAGQQDMVSLIKNQRARAGEPPYVGVIHRLDQPVEGVMVFAKDAKAAGSLSKQVAERQMDKYYLAVVHGHFEEKTGVLEHYLVKDGGANTSRIGQRTEANAKIAKLSYEVLAYQEENRISLVRVKLETGRHHQIRLQFSATGHPLVGDQKYGSREADQQLTEQLLMAERRGAGSSVALCSCQIGFTHPGTKAALSYEILPENPYFAGFSLKNMLDH